MVFEVVNLEMWPKNTLTSFDGGRALFNGLLRDDDDDDDDDEDDDEGAADDCDDEEEEAAVKAERFAGGPTASR